MVVDFTDKLSIVTGGETGIGRGIAELLLSLNSEVIITGLGEKPKWCENHEKCYYRKVDFLNQQSTDTFISEISNLTKIDILINNAGIIIMHSIDAIELTDWNKVMQVNVTLPMRLISAAAPIMKLNRKGKILNISSIAGLISKPGQSSYSASKSSLIGLTRSCALDLAPFNILVNALCPGTTQTKMVETTLTKEQKDNIISNIPMNRLATVSEVASWAIFLCSDINTYMTGQTTVVDGGFTVR
jgi:3-oxoacyl-[acyl-carrier protein] reductase